MLLIAKKKERIMCNTIHYKDIVAVDWLNLKEHGAVIAGGAALRWYQNQPVLMADIDVFFQNKAGFDSMRQHIESLPIHGVDLDFLESPRPSLGDLLKSIVKQKSEPENKILHTRKNICSSDRAETYEVIFDGCDSPYKIQLIKTRYTTDIMDLINSFDISVSQVATDGQRWYVGEHFIQDLKDRRLRIKEYNQHSLKRMLKYWSYGFMPTDDTIQHVIDNPGTTWYYEDSSSEDYHDL